MKNLKKIIILCLLTLTINNIPFYLLNCSAYTKTEKPVMSIVIDDFGSWDQSGVEALLSSGIPITCAVLPNVDNTQSNIEMISKTNAELILHMPMQAYSYLPESWYGPVYITNHDSPESACEKLDKCLKTFPNVKGFNIHIGSGVGKNREIMTAIYSYARKNNLYFLDSRTVETTATVDACKATNSVYLGRDVFLEPNKNRSYQGVKNRLLECANIAKEKGYSIAIGHVGAEGGENTARAIIDMVPEIEKMGIEIVPVSKIYQNIKQEMQINSVHEAAI